MASLDTDINMVPAGEGSSGAVGPSAAASSSTSKKPKRFEIKKWNAVALWAWGMCPIHKRLAVRVDSLVLDETSPSSRLRQLLLFYVGRRSLDDVVEAPQPRGEKKTRFLLPTREETS
ncbi:hypothetical protein GW17_00014618 [Ensete ventricosum]|nr:hypothetical protein GW17_00014618 [Ensete ventricosum]